MIEPAFSASGHLHDEPAGTDPPRRWVAPGWGRIDLLLVLVMAAIVLWRLWPAIEETPFHRDEARWVGNSQLLREWRDPFSDRWQDESYEDIYGTIDERNRRRSQPPLAMYVLGLGIVIQRGELPEIGYWIMTQNTHWNTEQGNMPSAGELRAGRRTDVAIAILTVVALYAAGRLLTNRSGGVVTGLFYGLHPLTRDTASRAWSDPLLGLCIVLAALSGYRLAVRPTPGRAALFGAAFGLGAATKLSPLAVGLAAGAAGALIVGWQLVRRAGLTRTTRLGLGLLSTPAIAFAVFVACYPYLWTDPAGQTRRMFDVRTESFQLQAEFNPEAKVEDRADALRRVGIELGRSFSVGGWIAGGVGLDDREWTRNLDLAIAVIGWL
ncbi:MAG: glycosyltransferase family 39 protein, partial [Thermomicrobiales bacterium]|nr:glycosyltransferase family 39 protein [Thermomicrobiales bacterium]